VPRLPPDSFGLLYLKQPQLTPDLCERLLAFNREYQTKGFRYFAYLKLMWEKRYPGKTFPGLCAEVDSISGEMRPLEEQRAWGWGDTRALGIWCYFLMKGRIPDEEVTLDVEGDAVTINLKAFYSDYCRHIYRCLRERMELCGGRIPFLADVETNRPSDDPRNLKAGEGEMTATDIFAINAFFQYGLWQDDAESIELGERILDDCLRAGVENRFVNHLTRQRSFEHTHGILMVCVGAVVDTLKTIDLIETRFEELKDRLVRAGRWALDQFCGYHWDPHLRWFSEYLHPVDKTPFEDSNGHIVCDPGHTAEGVGFFAEYLNWLPDPESTSFRFGKDNTTEVLQDILLFVHEHGYAAAGVMFKNIDLKTMKGIAESIRPDVQSTTAPWWNVRECAAAAIKLYQLTGDPRMWEIYQKAFNAAYQNYPNRSIGGLMVQNLDAFTLEPVPIFPATGNLDPMHSPRAREREIEALERMEGVT
jgi:hypothetical protein